MSDILFTPCELGPITLRNRSIRSAAFENMCIENKPSQALFDYHWQVAKGGIGMTTLAYAAVNRSGLSFKGQLWMREEIVPELKKITDTIHQEGAKVSIQLGHCGNMTHYYTCGQIPVGASTGFNLYSPTIVRALKIREIEAIVNDFGRAVHLSRQAGFDCVEIHAGHGYLISQFLSPYTNKRKDKYGGSLENRMRFMKMVIAEVMQAASDDMAVVVKTNMYDGFKSGMQIDDCIAVAKELEKMKVHALVLSAGFVSRAPMAVMHGAMPIKTMAYYMDTLKFWWLKLGLRMIGKWMVPEVPFKEAYFLEDAKKFREALKLPLIYVGGLLSRAKIEEVLSAGFDFVQIGRALIHDTQFINNLKNGAERCDCKHSNYCIARMYTLDMKCHHCVDDLPKKIRKEIEKAEKK
ncbi:MAG: NADH:flavin oxidoreductase [Bacteroidales bacterium]|jgi:2,4-dienoyl-CoA reductase-like NADH-dependent reductase (Old Yellow Enzyme family)|nr:NADH:flavin oxidoreductase [Bacteroidales bacterium]MDD3330355.1 NADH:flavin oxidoreductase [Bacteroidales bacterium]MDD3690761.1 NADH:flavin oxidoreductase [Bacteroidales bacterium]MDD4044296.1 NADH:flavin oxidoreductase [Bacteroidales bacterium]MDD4581155.1 NADH:flavin oxidoreductase [Bacteroidales bacterium]